MTHQLNQHPKRENKTAKFHPHKAESTANSAMICVDTHLLCVKLMPSGEIKPKQTPKLWRHFQGAKYAKPDA